MPKFILIAGDEVMDGLLHAADVFESFKVFAQIHEEDIELKPGISHGLALAVLKREAEKKGMRVVAAFVPHCAEGTYLDPTVRAISDGKKWVMLDKVLEAYGYKGPDEGAT